MKRLLLSVFMLFALAGPAMACQLNSASLPDEVKKQLEIECLKAEKAAKDASIKAGEQLSAEKLSVYADAATQMAKALGLAAKELGVAVNDFITTPAGVMTVFFIFFKVFGKLIVAFIATIVINMITWKVADTLWHKETTEKVEVTRWFGFSKRLVNDRRRISYSEADESLVGWSIALVLLSVAPAIVMFIVA